MAALTAKALALIDVLDDLDIDNNQYGGQDPELGWVDGTCDFNELAERLSVALAEAPKQ